MERLVAKISYEWFCYLNKVDEKYDEFEPIINFIETGKNNNFVSYVIDEGIYGIFSKISIPNSHVLILYEDENNHLNVLVSIFGVCIYKVDLGNQFPAIFKTRFGFAELQVTTKKIEITDESHLKFQQKVMDSVVFLVAPGVNMALPIEEPEKVGKGLLIGEMIRGLNTNSFITKGNEDLFEIVLSNYTDTLSSTVIHIRKLKRFVKEHFSDLSVEKKLNPNGGSSDVFFLYYIVYLIGKHNFKLEHPSSINDFLRNNIREQWTYVLNEDFINSLKDKIFNDSNYEKFLLDGAKLINDAEYF